MQDELRKRGLGRGLDALIPLQDDFHRGLEEVTKVPIEEIKPNPLQPRKTFDEESLEQLSLSIKENGIIQPLIVTRREDSSSYELVAGERRLRAAKKAGLTEVPVIVKEAAELKKLEMAIVENVQRENLNAIEEAAGYRELIQKFSLSQEVVAKKVGKSRSAITNKLRLLVLPIEVQKSIREGQISEGHGRALLGLDGTEKILVVFKEVIAKKLSVRDTEHLVARLLRKPLSSGEVREDPNILSLEKELREVIGCKVTLKQRKRGGSLIISYTSAEDLERIVGYFAKIGS